MLDLGPQAAAIMAIKSPSSDKESCKSNPILGNAHMLAVIQLDLNNLMSLCIFSAIIQHYHLPDKTQFKTAEKTLVLINAQNI